MEQEQARLQRTIDRCGPTARTWLLLGPSSEQLIPLTKAFFGCDPSSMGWTTTTADEEETLPVHMYDGHLWIDGEAIRPCPLEFWRKYLTTLSEGTTLDQHLNRGCRWIVIRGLEMLSAEHLGCLADCLSRGGRGWILLGASSHFPRYQRISQRAIWWMASPESTPGPAYRLNLPARATMASFSHIWLQFMKGKATLEELDEGWLQLVARDVPWEQALSLLVREALHAPDRALGRQFLQCLLDTERRPRQRDIFTWRWILHLAQETFSTSKLSSQ